MEYKYDIFISFKNSTEQGYTVDREVALRFFEELKNNSCSVFYSNKSLREMGSSNYMLELQRALESSKNILVIFSDINYISGGWVMQEWTTFLNLLLKDDQRKIFTYCIETQNNDISLLPPFLRPFECFNNFDTAVKHIINAIKHTDTIKRNEVIKRDFLNAYWNLFGNTDISQYIVKSMTGSFYNYEVYIAVYKYLCSADNDAYCKTLNDIIKKKDNPLAGYVLSMYYRDIAHLDLVRAHSLRISAKASFMTKINNSSEHGEFLLAVLHDQEEYDGAFYMCDCIHDVLDAYDIKTSIILLDPAGKVEYDIRYCKRIVLFWSDVCLGLSCDMLDFICANNDKLIICLNSFGQSELPYDLKQCTFFENSRNDITKVCRILLG